MSAFILMLEPSLKGRSCYGISATFSQVATPDGRPLHSKPSMVSFPDAGEVRFSMPPGIYTMEAFLPSGDVVNGQYTLADDDAEVRIQLAVTASERPFDGSILTHAAGRDFKYPSAGGMSGFHQDDDPEIHVEFKWLKNDDSRSHWKNILHMDSEQWWDSTTIVDRSSATDAVLRITSFPCPRMRCWSQVTRGGESRVASLPFEPFPGPARTVEIYRSQSDHRLISLVDDRVGLILDYLADGHVGAASQTLDRLENEIRSTMHDGDFVSAAYRTVEGPISLCAAAYAASTRRADNLWREVALKLMAEDWLPDGAVLAGRSYLYGDEGEEGWKKAAECFRTAIHRGVPYFSMGLLYLNDGLTILADFDHSLRSELATVTTVAKRSSRGEAFTVLSPGPR